MTTSRTVSLLALILMLVLAGCSSKTSTSTTAGVRAELAPDKGAITGLVIDDRYRPVADADVVLLPNGLTATADGEGQFEFRDLPPGSYEVRSQASGHESAPVAVDVVAGQYTEVEVQARRIFSDSGSIITTEYSVFSPCMQSAVLVALVDNYCMPDSSGDSYRPGITIDFRKQGANITWLVGEILINQPDEYVFVMRCAEGGSFGCEDYGQSDIHAGTYGKVVLQYGANHMNTFGSHPWNNTHPIDSLLFFYGTGGSELTPVAKPAGCTLPPTTNPLNGKPAFCRDYYGAGAKFAVEAKIIVSAFIGPPADGTDPDTYAVLQPKA